LKVIKQEYLFKNKETDPQVGVGSFNVLAIHEVAHVHISYKVLT